MLTIDVVLIVGALVCFAVSAAGVPARVNLQSLGLALWVTSLLV